MPEFYVEPMKDRQTCFVCKMTVTGKKVLLTCINCHAITYCGVECQKTDWERHEWNCVPVMVTEFPGKGRGLVAARNIEKGELIFKDKPAIKLAVTSELGPVDPEFMTSMMEQIERLPSEAKLQFYKLKTRDDIHAHFGNNEVLKLFLSTANTYKGVKEGKERYTSLLHLNIALLNHSCAPNASNNHLDPKKQEGNEDNCVELRALKNIRKGEEITTCYFNDVKKFGGNPRKWKTVVKTEMGFECKCPVCLGQVPGQEKIVKKLIDLHEKLDPTLSDWNRQAGLWSRIVELTMELNIGHPFEKTTALESFAIVAHLARDKDLVNKALDTMKQFAEEYKFEVIQSAYKRLEMGLAFWSSEFSSSKAPEKIEIDLLNKMKINSVRSKFT